MTAEHALRLGTPQARLAMLALVTASGIAFLDSSVVTVALPRIGDDLGGGLATLQWVMDAYLLTLGAFLLVGGALGDLLGKKRVFLIGVVAFGIASALCGLAPTAGTLVAARAVQGVAAALLVPGSLAIITAAFDDTDRPRAIGLWSGLSGLFTMLGPFVGGVLVDAGPSGWRWVFWLNLPLVALAVVTARRYVPALPGSRSSRHQDSGGRGGGGRESGGRESGGQESGGQESGGRESGGRAGGAPAGGVDLLGGLLGVVGLGLVAGALIEAVALGAALAGALVGAGVAVLVVLAWWELRLERRGGTPMLPPSLFAIRSFTVANLVTLCVYGPLGASFFLLTVQLMVTAGWSALAAGAAGVPITLALAALSGRIGGLVPRFGARPFLVAGPVVMASGMALLAGVSADVSYLIGVLPGIAALGAGLVLVVAPVTAAALGDVGGARAGAASGVNNAVARVATLLAVAALPLAAGMGPQALAGGSAAGPGSLADGYPRAMLMAALLCAVGAAVALALPRDTGRVVDAGGGPPAGHDSGDGPM